MRQLFLVLAKLFGVLQLFYGLVGFVHIGFSMYNMRAEMSRSVYILATMLDATIFLVVSMGVAWLLLARTEWLADKLRIEEEAKPAGFDMEPLLFVGVTLIGVYVTIHAIPALAGALVELRWMESSSHVWDKITSSVVQLGLGIVLMLWSPKVIGLITRWREMVQSDDTCDAEHAEQPPQSEP